MLLSLQRNLRPQDQEVVGFFEEQYSYLAVVSNVSPRTLGINHHVDRWLDRPSLDSLNRDSSIYGCLFGCSHQLYETIPRICDLAQRCRDENFEPCSQTRASCQALLASISAWEPDPSMCNDGLESAGRLYQEACLVFLHTSFHGPRPRTAQLDLAVKTALNRYLEHFSQLPYDSAPWTTISWPALICGSCMRDKDQREQLSSIIRRSTIQMRAIDNILHPLSLLWTAMERDDVLFGPYGLEEILAKNKLNLCIG